jgi:hypothetical protein
MVVGRRPFGGATRSDVIAAILEREPDALAGVQPMRLLVDTRSRDRVLFKARMPAALLPVP